MTPGAVDQFDTPDDPAALKLMNVGQLVNGLLQTEAVLIFGDPVPSFQVEGQGGMDKETASEARRPGSVLDDLAAVDDRPGPGLFDR